MKTAQLAVVKHISQDPLAPIAIQVALSVLTQLRAVACPVPPLTISTEPIVVATSASYA